VLYCTQKRRRSRRSGCVWHGDKLAEEGSKRTAADGKTESSATKIQTENTKLRCAVQLL
jgi:hypothetical protein